MSIAVNIKVKNRQSSLKISPTKVKRIVSQVLAEEGQACDEVAIHFVDTAAIMQLHEDFFGDPSPTDCISFPLDSECDSIPYQMLGEVFVCPETAIEYASKHQMDPYEETTLYIVHGLLHLMGYDDLQPEDRKAMRKAEARHMRNLRKRSLQLTG